MSEDVFESDSADSDSYWNEELINAIRRRQGKSKAISEEDRIKQIEECLMNGANIDAVFENGNTVLHVAVKKRYSKIVQFLVRMGAKTDIRNQENQTALTLAEAFENESKNILKALIEPNDRGSHLASLSTAEETVIRESNLKKNLESKKDIIDQRSGTCQQTPSFSGSDRYATVAYSKNVLHGIMFQVKLVMLFVWRGLQRGYPFRLTTDMDDAEKFDDLVFQYRVESENKGVYRFLQVKHVQNETKKITAHDLLTEKFKPFNLQQYFASYRKIRRNSTFSGNTLKDFIIWTNIDFDFQGLESAGIKVNRVTESDDFINIESVRKQSARYKFFISYESKLWKILKQTADVYKLAKILVEHVYESKEISLRTDLFRRYHIALTNEVIDVENKRLFSNFIKGQSLSERGDKFREIFLAEALERITNKLGENPPACAAWEKIKGIRLKISLEFRKKFQICDDPMLDPLEEFSEELVKLIKRADNDNLVKVDGRVYRINAKPGSREEVFRNNISKLAGHVLIMEDKKIKFRSQFFDDTNLPGNLKDLRSSLKDKLGTKYDILHKYQFEMPAYFQTIDVKLLHAQHELPGDEVDGGEIEEFFDKLIFAVNQPNEIELGDIITREISSDKRFSPACANFVAASFEKEILEWCKGKGTEKREGRFYSHTDAQNFFDSTEIEVNILMASLLRSINYVDKLDGYDMKLTGEREGQKERFYSEKDAQVIDSTQREFDSRVILGVSSCYQNELKSFGIYFKEEYEALDYFLTSNFGPTTKSALNLIAAQETLPTAIRVQEAIQQSGRYKENDGLMFLHLRTLLSPDIMERVTRAFKSPDSHYLLVIDCELATEQELQELYSRLSQMMSQTMANDKKLILITSNNKPPFNLQSELLENCETIYDDVSLGDLRTDSQLELMRKEVIRFQGFHQRTSFETLLGISGCHDTIMEDLGGAIDASTLVKLIRHEGIKIGSDVRKFGMIKPYYIPRTIQKIVIIKEDVFDSQSESDVIAVSTEEDDVPTSCKIVLKRDREAEEFGELCEKESGKNVHWLKYVLGKFIWYRSRGDISFLVKYRDVSVNQRSDAYEIHEIASISLTEDQLADHDDGQKVVIIFDSAGAGKSTMLTYLARKIQERKPENWVIRIDLNDFTDVLGKELRDMQLKGQGSDAGDTHRAVKFLVEKLSGLETELDKKVLEIMMKDPSKVILLFDGFDEISPNYTDMVIGLLQGLAKIGAAKLFVATRPRMRALLENKFGTFSHTMELFSEKDQIDFLIRFWKVKLRLDGVEDRIEQRLKTYAEALVKVGKSIGATAKGEVFSVPGQLRIIAELSQKMAKEYSRSENNEPDSSIIPRPIELYRTFVERKFNRYSTEYTNLPVRQDAQIFCHDLYEKHQRLAVHTLFNVKSSDDSFGKSSHPYLLKPEEIEDINAYITEIIKGRERTGIITHVENGRAQFIHHTFAAYFAATFVFDTLLKQANDDLDARQFLIREILLESQHKVIRSFLNGLLVEASQQTEDWHAYDAGANDAWKDDLVEFNYRGDTIFHIAAREGHYEIMKFFLNRIDQHETRKDLISARVGTDNRTVLGIVVETQKWDEIMWLIENGGAEANSSIGNGYTGLHAAASQGNLDVVKRLVEKGAFVDLPDDDGATPLHCAASSGEIALVDWLMKEKGADVKSVTKEGETVLVYAARFKCWDVVRFLADSYHVDIEVESKNGSTVLFYAVEHDNVRAIEWLVKKKGIPVGKTYANGRSILHHAIKARSINVVKWLVEVGYADPNETNNEGVTPLAQALKYDQMEIFEWLVDYADADVNVKDKHGMTSLHLAAKLRSGIIHLLVHEYGADIHALDNDGKRPVDLYADPKAPYYELLKFGPV